MVFAIILLSVFSSSFGNGKKNDVPVWNVGDNWNFDLEFSYEIEQSTLFLNITARSKELQFKVAREEGEFYYLDFKGNLELKVVGNIENINISASLRNAYASGYAYFKKSDLSLKEVYINITGLLVTSVAPLPIPFSASIKLIFTPSYAFISFPISEGSSWLTMPSIMRVELGEDLISFIKTIAELLKTILPSDMDEIVDEMLYLIDELFPAEKPVGLYFVECKSHSYLNVKAGTYEAYYMTFIGGISALYGNAYFSPTAKNIIKIYITDGEYLDFSAEIISSNYHQPGTPGKPQKPVGKERIRIRKSYEYESYAVDPDGDRLQYGWDWNGDYIVDEWTGFYPSGEKVRVSHKWDKKGDYEIRVRARDEKGLESEWSDSLAITVPLKNYRLFTPLISLLQDVLCSH